MIETFALLLLCQLAGEVLSHGFGLPMPGPVIGLLILFAGLVIAQNFGKASAVSINDTALGRATQGLLQHLSLLFVPAGVGVIDHLHLLQTYGPVLFLALFVSTALSLAVTALTFTAVKSWRSPRGVS
ncbi:CidA/LrgA family protein [Taklimakanibacter deserti]|uniref:CidA/LrgA family protein n=1 Tax=Taklimakanibacter deserti TaxID=2267839 RepID=UPI000E64CA2C